MNSLGLPLPPPKTRVVVAMSGGVDSSVVAGLLQQEGYDVVGITLQLYDHGEAVRRKGACCAGQDIHDARRVAETLGIPHYVLDYEDRFRQSVIEEFAASYRRGETPIPCVQCNRTVKFRDLLGVARDLGAAALATGHYVRRDVDADGRPRLLAAADPTRDQSYFLFATTPEQLAFLRFPLGGMPKEATRRMAAELGLNVADKPDSQDICFVPSGRYTDVIERLHPGSAEPGDIVHLDGRVLGRHEGVMHFTVGQRRGVAAGQTEALYVVRLEPSSRRVIVGPRQALLTRTLAVREVNWLGGALPDEPLSVQVRLRSSQPLTPAEIRLRPDGGADVALYDPQGGVAPGQACVFYRGDEVLGGGFIAPSAPARAA